MMIITLGLLVTPKLQPLATTVTDVADAYVTAETPSANFGTRTALRTDTSPIVHSYIKFNVNVTGTITKATFRVYANTGNSAGYKLYTANNSWTETGITYNNAPSLGSLIFASPSFGNNQWIDINVTSFVKSNGIYTFAMAGQNVTATNFSSREGANPPQLILESGGATITPTATKPTVTQTATLPPPDTATVQPTTGTHQNLNFPIRAVFYYPWFPESWNQQGYNPFTRYQPTLGYYDSSNVSVIREHEQQMLSAKIQTGIASWWGVGTNTDKRISLLLNNTNSVKWTLYYEKEGSGNPSTTEISQDLTYIQNNYTNSPAYLYVNNKPVIFVYGDGADSCAMADRWKQANNNRFYVVLKVFSGYKNCASQPDSWHQYAPAVAEDHQTGYSFSISPGFWRIDEANARLARDITRFRSNVSHMIASGENWQLITTFNEWGEGTSIESSTQWGTDYLDALGGVIALTNTPVTNTVTATVTATRTPTRIPTATPTVTSTPVSTTTKTVTATSVPTTNGDPLFIGAGDISTCSNTNDDATEKVLELYPSATVYTLGDDAYESGTPTEYANCYDASWGKVKNRTKPSPGNHDYNTSAGSGYFQYFGVPQYYSYDVGAWHIVALNTEISVSSGSAEETWLKNDLASHNNKCVLAYWHEPRWSSDSSHGNSTFVSTLWNDLYSAGADIVLNGHAHVFEKFAPQNPSGQADPLGLTEFVVGTGGRSHYAFGTVKANSEIRNSTDYGVLLLTLHSASADWSFINIANKVLYNGTINCH